MVLCFTAAHASAFNTPCQTFFIKYAREYFFVSFVSFYQQIILATFYLILLHLSVQIHSFKPLRYTCEYNN